MSLVYTADVCYTGGMAKTKHRPELAKFIKDYAKARILDTGIINGQQTRISDGGFCKIDIWMSGKYHIIDSDYHRMIPNKTIASRRQERGELPRSRESFGVFMDHIFFPPEIRK